MNKSEEKHKHKWKKIWATIMPGVEGWLYICEDEKCGACKEIKPLNKNEI